MSLYCEINRRKFGHKSSITSFSISMPVSSLVHRPNLSSHFHESLSGKKVLILGADRASHSYNLVQKARLAGTVVYIALLADNEKIIRSYLNQDSDPMMHRDLHLLIIPNMFTGPDIDSIAEVILDEAKKAYDDDLLESHNRGTFFDACITFQDNLVQLACDLCHLWDLPGCESDGVWSTIDKHLFRAKIEEFNLIGRVCCQRMEDFVQEFLTKGQAYIKFPLVLKPCAGHGSRGIYLVHSLEEMKEKRATYERDFPHRFETWIVEEYLDGPEVGIELIMHRGRCYFASVMEACKTPPPVFQGIARFVPASLGDDECEELVREAITTAQLLGLNNTVLDIDAKYIPGRGPILLEINCRMGGFSVRVMHQTAFGIDLVTQHIRCGCGLEPDFFLSGGTYEPNGSYYAKLIHCDSPDRNGVLCNLTLHGFADSIRCALPDEIKSDLTSASLFVPPGAIISGGQGKHPLPILAAIVVQGYNIADAREKADKIHLYASQLVINSIVREDLTVSSSIAPTTKENIRFQRR